MKIRKLAVAAVTGSAYAALTAAVAPIAYGPLQLRVSEVLCILPFFIPGASWGLAAGCAVANLVGGYGVLDVVFGSLATLCAGICTSRTRSGWLACLFPVLWNGVVVGAVLAYVTAPGEAFWGTFALFGTQVAAGEAVVMFGLGLPLLRYLPKVKFLAEFTER